MVIYSLVESNRRFWTVVWQSKLFVNNGYLVPLNQKRNQSKVLETSARTVSVCPFLRHRDKDHQEARSITLDIHIILLSWPIQYNDIVVFVRCFLPLLGICWWKPVIPFFASRPDNLQNLIRYSV